MWKGRFQQDTARLLGQYSESISFDWRLHPYDIQGSIAHSKALLAAGILTPEEQQAIENGLREIGEDITAGKFQPDPALEDVHMNIEAELTRRIGPAGAKLHTARSRNDQVALDLRLCLRAEADAILALVRDLQKALIVLGERNREVVIPGYTHLQRAQPVLFAHHLLAYVEMFDRDAQRLADLRKRIDVMPLGSGAIAGSTIALDRALVARELGFAAVTQNSMDAVADRDFACELLAAIAIAGMHLSRLSEDIILWASSEFGFVIVSDAFSTGSSLMPQKKNPDVAELTRGKTGRLYGNLLSLLTTLKGLPLTYNRDMQEDKEPVFDSVDTIKAALEVNAAMLGEMKVNAARAAEAVGDPMLLATDLADYLVRAGMPFRQAHEVIGKLVAHCIETGKSFPQLGLAEFQGFSPVFQQDVFQVLDLRRALQSRTAAGAPSPANVKAQLERWRALLP
ncbi:MAG TPA: argininosuccinate lyase [Chthoniobacteraceae bacterium]|jgi:argininosuccinate lyase|nr:argininosuccinate lyase [Chthoniobacteraceae bacterium]